MAVCRAGLSLLNSRLAQQRGRGVAWPWVGMATHLQQSCQGAPHAMPAEADLAARDRLQVVLRRSMGVRKGQAVDGSSE